MVESVSTHSGVLDIVREYLGASMKLTLSGCPNNLLIARTYLWRFRIHQANHSMKLLPLVCARIFVNAIKKISFTEGRLYRPHGNA
jgi:hypothetical protein